MVYKRTKGKFSEITPYLGKYIFGEEKFFPFSPKEMEV
jgi:hypothetical protein